LFAGYFFVCNISFLVFASPFPEYLKQSHNIPDDLLKNIRAIAEEAVR
jgi:hypothetical protein